MSERDKICKLDEMIKSIPEREVTRRELIKSGALLGGVGLLMSQIEGVFGFLKEAEAKELMYPLADAKHVIYSVCLQCHTACPIKVKILDGIAVKIDGNPYSAQNMIPNIRQDISPWLAAKIDAKLCPKGQAGIQSLYDPYRIIKVLKRDGPRGSNRWKVIPFSQAIDEIVIGGYLFKDIGENRRVPGLKELYKLKDFDISEKMAKDAKKVAKH